jgi:carboxypeptidase Q
MYRFAMGAALLVAVTATAQAQTTATQGQTPALQDPVLRQIWEHGMERSHAYRIGQALLDSIGPRLTASPGHRAANDWAVKLLQSWGIEARNEQYGTWRGWRRGVTHIDLIQPRVRSLEGMMLSSSGDTEGRPVEGPVVLPPVTTDSAAYRAWLGTVRGKFVAIAEPQVTCRPNAHFTEFGRPGAVERLDNMRDSVRAVYQQRVGSGDIMRLELERAGAAGILESRWDNNTGTNTIFGTNTNTIPTIDLSCEDYGLLWRLAENNQGPVVRVTTESEFLGEIPVYNTIGMIRGTEKPNEYVMLSAHYDSWDGASGATDNGTGSILMLETMRILKQVYPRPKRTIMIALWGGEEQGLNGSRRFAAMHPEIVEGLQALFNQDNGTGRIASISLQGLSRAGEVFKPWLAQIPTEITQHITVTDPGVPGSGGSDYASFICLGAPAFSLSAINWMYRSGTWHTNRDTFDKIVFEEIRNNVTLTAMLVYLASEEPRLMPRDRITALPPGRGGQPGRWPECTPGREKSGG